LKTSTKLRLDGSEARWPSCSEALTIPRIRQTAAALGLAWEPDLLKSAGSRPRVHVDGDRIGAVIFKADEGMEPAPVRVLAGRRGS
jgi:hypothetical protein